MDHELGEVIKQLGLNRPVYMRGYDSSGILGFKISGHAWVCDASSSSNTTKNWILKTLEDTPYSIVPKKFTNAYTKTKQSSGTYLHMNWGWNGQYDGNYYYSNVSIPGLNLNFAHGRENIVDIYPNK